MPPWTMSRSSRTWLTRTSPRHDRSWGTPLACLPPADRFAMVRDNLGRVCKRLEPEQDHADVDHGEIVVGTLFIPGGDALGLLEAIDRVPDLISPCWPDSACRSDRMRCQIPALRQRENRLDTVPIEP